MTPRDRKSIRSGSGLDMVDSRDAGQALVELKGDGQGADCIGRLPKLGLEVGNAFFEAKECSGRAGLGSTSALRGRWSP